MPASKPKNPNYTINRSKPKGTTSLQLLHDEAREAHIVQRDCRADFHSRVQAELHGGRFDAKRLRPWFEQAMGASPARGGDES
jgi:hypothetical protein